MATALPGLTIRKVADRGSEQRVVRYDAETGARLLVDPSTADLADPSSWQHSPWPLAGIEFVDKPPRKCRVPSSFISRGLSEGWIETEGLEPAHRPGGPPEDPWRVTHTFTHYDTITFKCIDGDVRYRVVRQPDKYAAGKPDNAKVTDEIYASGDTELSWFFDLELEG